MLKIFSGLFDSNEKQLKKIQPLIDQINDFEESVSKLSDEKLREKTVKFRKSLGVALENARTQEDILIDV